MSAHIGRHRPPSPLHTRHPLTPSQIVTEALFVAVRHLADGRTPDDAWELARVDATDMRAAAADASRSFGRSAR